MNQSDSEVLAQVYGEKLQLEELSSPAESMDSLTHMQEQVEAWATRQLWANAAKELPFTPRMERMVEDYKNSLLIAAYQTELVSKSKLVVDEQMVLNYYKENQESFLLDDDLYKIQFFQIRGELDASALIPMLNEGQAGPDLTNYCETNPEECMFRADWVEPSTLEALDLPNYLWKTSGTFEQFYKDENTTLIYRIEAKRTAGEAIPLDRLRDKIVSILTFQLEKELIEKHEAELLYEAQKENHFEIY